MFIRMSLASLLLISVLAACGNAPSTPNTSAAPSSTGSSATPTTMLTTTPVNASNAAQPSTPPTIVGEITQVGERVLVEQHPGATIGDKIVFSLNNATRIVARVGDDLEPKTVGDLAVGQRVEVWAAGTVAESFPGQAGAETILIVDAAASSPGAAAPPDQEPDAVGTITQATNSVVVDQSFVLFMTPTTQFFRKEGTMLKATDAREVTEGLQVEAWVDKISYEGSPPRGDAVAIVIINN